MPFCCVGADGTLLLDDAKQRGCEASAKRGAMRRTESDRQKQNPARRRGFVWPETRRSGTRRAENCKWLRGKDLNLRPLGYEPNELPGCSTPQYKYTAAEKAGQTLRAAPSCGLQSELTKRTKRLRMACYKRAALLRTAVHNRWYERNFFQIFESARVQARVRNCLLRRFGGPHGTSYGSSNGPGKFSSVDAVRCVPMVLAVLLGWSTIAPAQNPAQAPAQTTDQAQPQGQGTGR